MDDCWKTPFELMENLKFFISTAACLVLWITKHHNKFCPEHHNKFRFVASVCFHKLNECWSRSHTLPTLILSLVILRFLWNKKKHPIFSLSVFLEGSQFNSSIFVSKNCWQSWKLEFREHLIMAFFRAARAKLFIT